HARARAHAREHGRDDEHGREDENGNNDEEREPELVLESLREFVSKLPEDVSQVAGQKSAHKQAPRSTPQSVSSLPSIKTVFDDRDQEGKHMFRRQLEWDDPYFADKSTYRNRQLLNDMPSFAHRRNVLLFVMYVPSRGMLEVYIIARKKRLCAVTVFPKCKLIYTYNWNTSPPWPYILLQQEDGTLYKLMINSEVLNTKASNKSPYNGNDDDDDDDGNDDGGDGDNVQNKKNIHENLKQFSVRLKEEWEYYSTLYFKHVARTFLFYCLHDNGIHLAKSSSQYKRKGFHTAVGKFVASMQHAHSNDIQAIQWFIHVNECDGSLSIGVVQDTPDLSVNVTQHQYFDFSETPQGFSLSLSLFPSSLNIAATPKKKKKKYSQNIYYNIATGWGYECSGTMKHNGHMAKYGSRYGTGDTITVVLN
ncbi:hypothetical protein RFI_08397, partial [Reticulomyxa filosa]